MQRNTLVQWLLLVCISMLLCSFSACNGKRILYGAETPVYDSTVIMVDSNMVPVIFDAHAFEDQWGFESIVLHKAHVKVFPNRGGRRTIVEIGGPLYVDSIFGVTHFLMDYDFTQRYRHPSITNFFKMLRPDDFVLHFHRSKNKPNEGWIEYIRKAEVTDTNRIADDIGFFRQWRLSEVDLDKGSDGKVLVRLGHASFAPELFAPQVKKDANNSFGKMDPGIPTLVADVEGGLQPLDHFDHLGLLEGGTAVIIWYDSLSKQNLFKDVHGSLKRVITVALDVAEKYHVDPTIGIYDAGRMAKKLRANNGRVSFEALNILSVNYPDYVSAGFGYVEQTQYVREHHRNGRIVKREYEMVKK